MTPDRTLVIESPRLDLVLESTEWEIPARVLECCGFECVGEVMDPEDGLVWRWERGA